MRPTLAYALLLAMVTAVPAAERTLDLDTGSTEVRFTLGATLHNVEGTVEVRSGSVRFDAEAGSAVGEIVVDATSAETGNGDRDKDMHKKVLESDRFGTFVLRPSELRGELSPSGPSQVELIGTLDIHGASHPVVLEAEVEISGDRLTGTAKFEVPYVDWGMKDPSKFVLRVQKHVTVEIALAGSLSSTEAEDADLPLPAPSPLRP